MSVQNSAQGTQERRGIIQQLSGMVRPGPALGYDLVRAYLGIGLFVRGILFVSQPELVQTAEPFAAGGLHFVPQVRQFDVSVATFTHELPQRV